MGDQIPLFHRTGSKVESFTALPRGGSIWSSWTGMARAVFMSDFKERALHPDTPFDPLHPVFLRPTCTDTIRVYEVTGDDGSTWSVGERGNSIEVIRQEIIACDRLWPEEKAEVLRWFDAGFHEQRLIMRLKGGEPVTEQEILDCKLPPEVEENLLLNLRNRQ